MNDVTSVPGGEWDREIDVVVVGTGAAGSVAAIEAAEHGAAVLALDRWGRGGASARSGGVIYAGGGTDQQKQAGFVDTPELMEHYLAQEEGVSEDDPLLRRFCERSRDDLQWLEERGVGIPDGFEPAKAIVPTRDDTGLYFSGNERHFAGGSPPVARGHRVAGAGMTGYALVDALHDHARGRGVEFLDRARLLRLVTAPDGRVTGVELLLLDGDPTTRLAHTALFRAVNAAAAIGHRVPRGLVGLTDRFERRRSRRLRIRARDGVILATGGFAFNHEMLATYAPAFRRTMPLGTAGDDGSGMLAAVDLGAAVRLMDRCGASRFYAPPVALGRGVLVDGLGRRICDESLYAATLSNHIAEQGGRAWLVIDAATRDLARAEILASPTLRGRRVSDVVHGRLNHLLFPWLFGTVNLTLNARRAGSIPELAARCGLPPDTLRATVDDYNERARRHDPDPLGKAAELVEPLEHGPYLAIRCGLDGVLFPAPCITLGGLDVDEEQRVRDRSGVPIAGLFAAGRCAAGVASRSYVSGLSLSDCVFSGRNAGRAVAAARSWSRTDPAEPATPIRALRLDE